MKNIIEKAIVYIENYYGRYNNELVRHRVYKYLSKIDEKILSNDFAEKLEAGYSRTYKMPPDVHALKSIFGVKGSEIEQVASEKFDELVKQIDIYADIVFDDSKMQAGLTAIGGWREFCNHLNNQRYWLRKNFIEAYVREYSNPITKPVLNMGLGLDKNKKVIHFGDKNKCEQVLLDFKMKDQKFLENMMKNLKKINKDKLL